MKRIIAICITLLLVPVLLAVGGCGSVPTEPDYAGTMTENVLTAINEGDYAKFSRDFDQAMKDALTEAAFEGLEGQLLASVGEYVSKEVDKVVVTDEYTTVIYNAKYTKADKVIITISFSTVDGKTMVSGLYFK